ncbi:MAG: OmpA family protein [Burkholderiales bacterium]
MNKSTLYKLTLGAVAAIVSTAGADIVYAHNTVTDAYLLDGHSSSIVKSGTGLCWRTGEWTPASALAECDPDLVKAPEPAKAMEAPAPAPTGPQRPAFEKFNLQADALFDFDKASLRDEGRAELDEFAAKMKQYPQVEQVLLTGHTDRIGSDEYNMALSQRRVDTVKAYLTTQGVEESRVTTGAKGETEPVEACEGVRGKALVDCLQPNRRVTAEVTVQRPTM